MTTPDRDLINEYVAYVLSQVPPPKDPPSLGEFRRAREEQS